MAEAAAAPTNPRAVAFSAGGVSGSVRPVQTGRDKLYRGIVLGKLYVALRSQGGDAAALIGYRACEIFADLCVCASDVEGFVFPPISASGEDIAAAFGTWLDSSADVYDAWFKAHETANAPTNDPALLPPEQLTDEKKAKSPKGGPLTAKDGTPE